MGGSMGNRTVLIFFMKVTSNGFKPLDLIGPGASFSVELNYQHWLIKKIKAKQTKKVPEIKCWTPTPQQPQHILGKIQKKSASQPHRELQALAEITFKKPKQTFIGLKASRERGYIKILPLDGTRACRPIGLDGRQLGLVREKRQIVDHGNMKMVRLHSEYLVRNLVRSSYQ